MRAKVARNIEAVHIAEMSGVAGKVRPLRRESNQASRRCATTVAEHSSVREIQKGAPRRTAPEKIKKSGADARMSQKIFCDRRAIASARRACQHGARRMPAAR